MRRQVESEYLHAARRRCEQAGKHLDCGGFACAVGTKEAIELTRRNREVHFLHRSELTEPAGETAGNNRIHRISNVTQAGSAFWRDLFCVREAKNKHKGHEGSRKETYRGAARDLLLAGEKIHANRVFE